MTRYSVFLILFILPLCGFAQKDFEPGYIITSRQDTITGSVKDRKSHPFARLYEKIYFKNEKGKKRKYSPNNINGYQRGGNLYESVWMADPSGPLSSRYTSLENQGEKRFLKVVSKGYLTYYHWEQMDSESDFISFIGLFKRMDEPLLVRVEQGVFGLKKKSLSQYFKDYPELAKKIRSGEIKDAAKIIKLYNEFYRLREIR